MPGRRTRLDTEREARRARPQTPLDVLVVEEQPLVEPADALPGRPRETEGRAGQEVEGARLVPPEPATVEQAPAECVRSRSLDHGRCAGVLATGLGEHRERAGRELDVVVHQQRVGDGAIGERVREAHVRATREPAVLLEGHDAGERRPRSRLVVDEHDSRSSLARPDAVDHEACSRACAPPHHDGARLHHRTSLSAGRGAPPRGARYR